MSRSVLASTFLGLLALAGCHHRAPVPSYPVPEDPPLEETDLAPFLETPDGGTDSSDGTSGEPGAPSDESVPVE